MASASIRKTCSHHNVYTWVAKIWDDRKKREHYMLLGNLELLPYCFIIDIKHVVLFSYRKVTYSWEVDLWRTTICLFAIYCT